MKQDDLTSTAGIAIANVTEHCVLQPRVSFYTKYGKRLFDLTFAIILLPLLTPLILLLALIISSDGEAPFFGHARVGKGGKKFKCWKLRTMCVGSEQMLIDHLKKSPIARAEWHENFRLSNDPRITRTGAILRKTKLDELTQIYNVLVGDLSFVGPRPITTAEIDKYSNAATIYFSERPGITGPWQIENSNKVTYEDRVQMDVAYRNNTSLLVDLKLMLMTPIKILTRNK